MRHRGQCRQTNKGRKAPNWPHRKITPTTISGRRGNRWRMLFCRPGMAFACWPTPSWPLSARASGPLRKGRAVGKCAACLPHQTTSDPSGASDAAIRLSARVSMTKCASTWPNHSRGMLRARPQSPRILFMLFHPTSHTRDHYKWAGAVKVANDTLDAAAGLIPGPARGQASNAGRAGYSASASALLLRRATETPPGLGHGRRRRVASLWRI